MARGTGTKSASKKVYLVGDFETTVYDNQSSTEVWASAIVEMYTEDVKIFHSISETYKYLVMLDRDILIYYHNLKFDGAFWLSYLMCDLKYKQAVVKLSEKEYDVKFIDTKEMCNGSFKYSISDMGDWYSITIKANNRIIEIRDSLKLLPFSVKRIGDSFNTKHKKLDMEYTGYRYAGCDITEDEKRYITNDVLVVKEALEIMYNEGHKKLTIGSCCLSEYKNTIYYDDYPKMFPNIYDIDINAEQYGEKTAGEYVRRSYKGGWCYLVKGKERKKYYNGVTADVNSLYPSMMSGESGNRYPIGRPHFWKGNFIPCVALESDKYYFVRIKTRFYLKPNMLPCIQIKNTFMYNGREWLETSDIYNKKDGKYYKEYYDTTGKLKQAIPILTLTMTDYELIKEHYDLDDFEILDGCWFFSEIGIFDSYIEKYKKIKIESKGAIRELAKLFLNNLYGKMATSTNSSFKYAYIKENGAVGFVEVPEYDKKPGYIPVGSAITSYARNFTIRAAQKNYYGKDKPGFIYADTDSIHCDLPEDKLVGVPIDDKEFCNWKIEAHWDLGFFVRQKTYIEHTQKYEYHRPPVYSHCSREYAINDFVLADKSYYNIKCAGMPDKCKDLFELSMRGYTEDQYIKYYKETWDKMSEEERQFVVKKRTIEDFDVGLTVPGKLLPRRIPGGVLLVETTYEMR